MTPERLLNSLSEQGVILWASGDRLHLRAPKGVLTPGMRRILSDRKADLLLALQQRNVVALEVDLQAEVVLDPTIQPRNQPDTPITESVSFLLTGATGFLGAFLLSELLQQTQATVYCLVRAASAESGRIKIQKNLESYGIWHENFRARIIAVAGDLSEPFLGLTLEQFQVMAKRIDAIYHSGASLNYIYAYERLKPTNVQGTQEVLRLASVGKIKQVHYISSSIAVFESSAYNGQVVTESDRLDHSTGICLGYSQSKWVVEKLIEVAIKRGLTVSVYRPPFIAGHSQTGVWNTDDIICRMIKGSIQIGCMADLNYALDIVPVDYVSQSIVYLSQQKESENKAFHLNNPRPLHWQQLVEYIQTLGYPIRKVPYEHWQELLSKVLRSNKKNPLYPLMPFFEKRSPAGHLTIPELHLSAKRPKISCQKTLDALASSSIVCPVAHTELIETYFSFFVRSGFLDAPQKAPSRLLSRHDCS